MTNHNSQMTNLKSLRSSIFYLLSSPFRRFTMRRALTLVVFAIVIACTRFASAADDTIKVEGGRISGTIENGVRTFKGIPFAAPPVGDLRWKAPQAVVPWQGVKQCD